ncbi:hypothetical protein ABK040_002093 [Willaertia magna]
MDPGYTPEIKLSQMSDKFHLKVGEEAIITHYDTDGNKDKTIEQTDFEAPKILKQEAIQTTPLLDVYVMKLERSSITCDYFTDPKKRSTSRQYKIKAKNKGECSVRFAEDKTVNFIITE